MGRRLSEIDKVANGRIFPTYTAQYPLISARVSLLAGSRRSVSFSVLNYIKPRRALCRLYPLYNNCSCRTAAVTDRCNAVFARL